LGLAAARSASQVLETLLFGTQATDWSSYAAASAAVLLTGLLATYLPAWRAAKIDPLVALRRDE